MKTFREFILEAYFVSESASRVGEKFADMTDSQFADWVKNSKGDTSRAKSLRDNALKARNTRVSGGNRADSPFSGKPQTPPNQPSGGAQQTQTPPRGTQTPPKSSSSLVSSTTKQAAKSTGKSILRRLGKVVGPAAAALDVADEKSKGSGWARSFAKGAVVAAGGALGGAAGSAAGPVGTIAGGIGGAEAASKAFDVAAGANAKERKGIATANRKTQAGGSIKGVGGKTTFDTKKNTITSGGKTAQLGKTSVVTNPKTGKQEVGNLAYKNGQAVYKRSDTKSLAQTSSNPFERIGRTINPNAYKQSDAANAAKKLNQARQSDVARNKALGVKLQPGK
jgi:hypothetical protein